MLNPNSELQSQRLPFKPHWNAGGFLQHWNFQHWTSRRHSCGADRAGSFVGRIGVLAVTFGIGTAVATGCLGCGSAIADTGDRGASPVGPSTSTSESVQPGPRAGATARTVRTGLESRTAVAKNVDDPVGSAPPRGAASRLAAVGTAGPSAAATAASPARAAATAIAVRDIVAPRLPSIDVPAVSLDPGWEEAVQTAAAPEPVATPPTAVLTTTASAAVVIASPPADSVTVEPTFTSMLAALSDAMMDTNSVPADTALALMLGAARRELRTAAVRETAVVRTVAAAATTAGTSGVEAEGMTVSGAARSVYDRNASGGYAIALTGAGQVSATLTLPEAAGLTLRLRTAAGAPNMTLSVDGVPYTTLLVIPTSYSDFVFAGGLSPGTHVISISSTTASTRNILYVDTVTTSSGPIVDEFLGNSGSAPSRLWTARSGTGFDAGNQTYSSSNAFLDGQGHLVIQATKGKKNSYTSGWVWTKNNLSFGYGTVTARVKMPKGQGLWPAVWMMGADSDTVGWPASGEIDIVELPSTTTTVYSTLHGPIAGTSSTQQAQIISTLPDLSTDYHDYWVRRMPDSITFGVDGRTLGTLTPADLAPGETWVYNRPMYMILNLAVGGSWAGAPNNSTVFPSKMLVESVTFAPA